MGFEYQLYPKPGFDPEKVRKDPNPTNAWVLVYKQGELVAWYPATKHIVSELRPMLHGKALLPEALHLEARTVFLEKVSPPRAVADKADPHLQIIIMAVAEGADTTEGIIDYITRQHRYLPDTQASREYIVSRIRQLHRSAHLLWDGGAGRWNLGRTLYAGYQLYWLEDGYDPKMRVIWDFVNTSVRATRSSIFSFTFRDLRWISGPEELDFYLKYMLRKGYLKEAAPGVYVVGRAIEPF